MVRWLKTDIGAIGFHALPRHVEDDSLYQTDDELGTRLSGGCQRQVDLDADFTWDFAQVGTKVVVLWPAAATSSRGPVSRTSPNAESRAIRRVPLGIDGSRCDLSDRLG